VTGRDLLLILSAYLLGAVPYGYLFTRWHTGRDIRTMGSGNIGATNVLRTQGKLLGILTLLLDFGKAAFSVWLCGHWGSQPWLGAAGGAAAVVGHCFPVFLGFRGGKGIASGLGAFLLIAPLPTLIALGVFLAELIVFRWVSLGSIMASITFGGLLLVFHFLYGWYSLPIAVIGASIGLLLVARHHKNIRNLLRGTESRLWGPGKDLDKP
jgi:acyl phosphate:glycerol-3-phosphate acyltransferase